MRGFSATGVMALVVAGLIGYAVYDYRLGEKKSAESAQKSKIVPLPVETISSIKVIKPDETIFMEKSGEDWKLTTPVADEIEAEAAGAYLASLGEQTGTELERPKAGFNWTEYNLDSPAAKFEIKTSDGSSMELSVSRLAAFDGRYFVRVADRLILGTSAWGGIAAKGSNQLRSKKVIRRSGELQTLAIETDTKSLKDRIVLKRQADGSWKMEGVSYAISRAAVDRFFDQLKNMRALDYLSGPARVDHPSSRLTLQFVKSEPKIEDWTLAVKEEKDGTGLASSSSVKEGFKLSQFDASQLRKSKADFRDGHEPFQLAVDQVQEIRVDSKSGGKRVLKKADAGWQLVDAKESEELVAENLEKILTQLNTLEAKSYFKPSQALGEVSEKVSFVDKAGKRLLELSAGGEMPAAGGEDKNAGQRYVKSSQTQDVLGVLSADLAAISFATVVRSKVGSAVESSKPQ